MKLLQAWEIHYHTNMKYHNMDPYSTYVRKPYKGSIFKAYVYRWFPSCWRYGILPSEYIYYSQKPYAKVMEKYGLAFTLEGAKRKADRFLEETGWKLLDKEPGLMVLL